MMKKYFLSGLLCLFFLNSQAQKLTFDLNPKEEDEKVSPIVKEKVDEYDLQVREIVVKEKLLMEKEIEKINTDLEDGKISKEDADNLKANVALEFSEKINLQIGKLDFNLNEITKQQVQYSIMNTDLEVLKQERKPKKSLYGKNYLSSYISFGMIHLPKGDNEKLNNHLGFSSGIDLGLIYHRQFNRSSPFEFLSGLYLSWRTLRFEDDYFIYRNKDGVVDLIQYDGNLKKSKLRTTYLMVPLGINYHFSKLKTDSEGDSYRDISRTISIGLMAYGGFKISQNNIVKGEGINWRHRKTSLNNTNFAYGAQLMVEIYRWSFYVKQELSPYFKNSTFDDRKMLQFGINFDF